MKSPGRDEALQNPFSRSATPLALMRSRLGLLIPFLLAGCLGEASPEAAPDETPLVDVADAPDLAVRAEETPTGRVYDLALRELLFDHALKRFALVADGDAQVRLYADVTLHRYGDPRDCAVLGVHVEDADSSAARVLDVRWFREAGYEPNVQVADQDVRPADTSSGAQGATYREAWNLTRGERLLVQVGGSTPNVALQQHTSDFFPASFPNQYNLTLNATGPVHMEALPDAELRCGLAHHGTVVQAGVGSGLVAASVNAEAWLDASQGGTLLFHPSQPEVPGRSVELEYWGTKQGSPSAPVEVASPQPGRLVVRLERWAEAGFDDTEWLLAASPLPVGRTL